MCLLDWLKVVVRAHLEAGRPRSSGSCALCFSVINKKVYKTGSAGPQPTLQAGPQEPSRSSRLSSPGLLQCTRGKDPHHQSGMLEPGAVNNEILAFEGPRTTLDPKITNILFSWVCFQHIQEAVSQTWFRWRCFTLRYCWSDRITSRMIKWATFQQKCVKDQVKRRLSPVSCSDLC